MKNKRKQQNGDIESENTILDIVETERLPELPKSNCQHVARAVELNHIKKSLKTESLKTISCSICSKQGVPPKKEENWVCLQCGSRLCCQEHLKNHFNIPRSDLHTIAFSLNNFSTWCGLCSSHLREEDSKKLKIVVGYIKQMMEKSKQVQIVVTPNDGPPPLVEWNDSNEPESAKTNLSNKKNINQRPAVRGLVNLGNTCFFNSVLQCLARTPKLVETLRRMESEDEHISITLNDGQLLEGKLGKSRDWLGQCLADTLVALRRPGDVSSENPLQLLQLLRKKCPQFEGYDQHDSHELLRHLLDNVRQNDLKRYRALMLSELGLSRKVNPQDVSAELTKKVKALDNEVIDKVTLVPDDVFRGLLVSTLECQDCHNTSECVEAFSDLSLPIMADKPQPPSIRRKGSASPELVDEKVGGLSKHQLKKQAKQARKKARNNRKNNLVNEDGLNPGPDSHSDKGESEADVEDNEEDKPHESGYSSEKIQSESSSLSGGDDSARTSPTTHVKEDRVGGSVSVCEGFPSIGNYTCSTNNHLVLHPSCESAPRMRRKPPSNWVASVTPSWIPHSDTTLIPNPVQVIESGDSWRNFVPREGLAPPAARSQKDSLNPILEENTEKQNSACHQVNLMSRVVESMLAQVHICQEDLDKYESNKVTLSRDSVNNSEDCNVNSLHNISQENIRKSTENEKPSCDNVNFVNDENEVSTSCQIDNVSTCQNEIVYTCKNENETVDVENENKIFNIKITLTPQNDIASSPESTYYNKNSETVRTENVSSPITDDTSNGFHLDTLYDKGKSDCESAKSWIKGENNHNEFYNKNSDSELNISPILETKVEKEDKEPVRRVVRRGYRGTDNKLNYSLNNKQEGDSDCSVQSCLSQFTALEIMSGANRVGCSTCTTRHNKGNKEGKTVYTIASKQLLIKKVPQVLILHLKRFQVQMYAFRKLSKHVSFPLYLDLAPFCLQDIDRDEDGRIMYSLYGVVEHSGGLNGGHYVAYVKVVEEENSNRWFCISDSFAHEVSETRVLQSQAYLLFYKRLQSS